MLPRERIALDAKKASDQRQTDKQIFDAMIKTQMSTPTGRKFVLWVLNLLQYNQPNVHNSAQAYRIAAVQNVAIDIQKQLYNIAPTETEKMVREGFEK